MGILNLTPDSFADGGRYLDPVRAVDAAQRLESEGAEILDVGGESTRPGARPVSSDEEIARVLPALERIVPRLRIPVSIDTSKAEVARRALEAGVAMVNDVSSLAYDADLAGVVAAAGVPLVLMHTRGRPREMYREARYQDLPTEVRDELASAVQRATRAGVAPDQIVVDPGLGFAKRREHTFAALANLSVLADLGHPILVGPSRKSFLQSAETDGEPDEREWGTAAAVTAAVLGGAHLVRVHGVRAMVEVVRVADLVLAAHRGRLRDESP